ncbi:MAG: DUF1178 family protein [Pelagibacteraceae bacterium]|jgi:hypothetical protein|nr:DUF1178 family protein [Pelagibacteraceae bacterium]MBO6483276.1 DUF1178 family protein [Pelagibacteraceae bacterium]MBO6484710.1 DUF1178 family protein [Pelagibacteraceae bacterium]MBO6485860.1 DUF1178 family protein [Pelagibacteraceae bacterium]MBO6486813.1 DUF1178 family protein [Pelagibacteraceae bacterium]
MIKYNLKCKHKHEFESWFLDSKEFEKLKSKKMIECIFCKTKSIEKSIMAPSVLSQEQKQKNQKSIKYIKKIQKDLLKMRNFVEKNFEYVGNNFPREVRNVYYDKRKNKNIYGKATPEETQELEEEGIELTAIPWIDNKKN